jgi:uncharacterized protein YndB with AHSA1/START domain
MMTIESSVMIAAPVERVFAACSDFEHAAERVTQIESVEMLTPGPVGVGTRFKETRIMFGKRATEEMEIAEFDPPTRYLMIAESHGARYETTFRFTPEQGGTRVTFEFTATPLTFFAKLMSPLGRLMAGTLKKCVTQDLEDVRQHLESDSAAVPA